MTRREEIINNIGYKITKAAVEYYRTNCANDVDLSEAFEEGAEWMQETMIEKAYKWILCNMSKYVKANRLDVFINNEDMANDFKRAMEE